MSGVRALAAALGALLLAACAGIAPQSDHAGSFDVLGRVLVSGEGRAFSSNLRWRHDAGDDELWLLSPVGQTLAHIVAGATGATLTTPDQQQFHAFSAENLTRRALGWPLPLAGLRYWIHAAPAPERDSGAPVLTRDAGGQVVALEQDGWSIRYAYPQPGATTARPRTLDLRRGDQRIRLVIDDWRTGGEP